MCLLITDTLGDLKEASLAGVNAIGVSWGFHDRRTLAKGNPFRIINKIEELPVIVHEYFAF